MLTGRKRLHVDGPFEYWNCMLPMHPPGKNESIVVSARTARTGFGKLLRRVDEEHRPLAIEKRGTPRAVLLSIRDYVTLTSLQINLMIQATPAFKRG